MNDEDPRVWIVVRRTWLDGYNDDIEAVFDSQQAAETFVTEAVATKNWELDIEAHRVHTAEPDHKPTAIIRGESEPIVGGAGRVRGQRKV